MLDDIHLNYANQLCPNELKLIDNLQSIQGSRPQDDVHKLRIISDMQQDQTANNQFNSCFSNNRK